MVGGVEGGWGSDSKAWIARRGSPGLDGDGAAVRLRRGGDAHAAQGRAGAPPARWPWPCAVSPARACLLRSPTRAAHPHAHPCTHITPLHTHHTRTHRSQASPSCCTPSRCRGGATCRCSRWRSPWRRCDSSHPTSSPHSPPRTKSSSCRPSSTRAATRSRCCRCLSPSLHRR